MRSIRSTCITVAYLSMLGLSALGAPITWQTPVTIINNDTQVSTTYAFRWAYTGGFAATVNTVTFTAGLNSSINNANIQVAGFTGSSTSAFNGGTSGTWNTLSPGYTNILTGAAYVDSAAATITLKSLVVGGSYLVQIWINDSRTTGSGRTAGVTSSGGNSVTLDYNDSNAKGGVGQFAIGTFTADAATQTFTITGNASSQLNAIQLRKAGIAASSVWTGLGDGASWNDPNNWNNGVPNADSHTAILSGTGCSIGLGSALSLGGMTFTSGGFMINGNGNTITLGSVTNEFAVTGSSEIAAVLAGDQVLLKSGSGVLTCSGANTFNGWLMMDGGTLDFTAGSSLNNLVFGVTNGSANVSVFNPSFGTTLTVRGLTVQTSSTGANSIAVPVGKTMALTDPVLIDTGIVAANKGAMLAMTGGGALTLTTTGNTIIGQSYVSDTSGTYKKNVWDLSALSALTAVANLFQIGYNNGTANYITVGAAEVWLPTNTTITVGALGVAQRASSASGNTKADLYLGRNTTIQADTIYVGEGRGYNNTAGTYSGRISWPTSVSSGTLTLAGKAGGTSAVDTMWIGIRQESGSGNGRLGVVDFSRGTVTGKVTNLIIAKSTSNPGTGNAPTTGTLTLANEGTRLDVTSLYMGRRDYYNSGRYEPITGTLNLNGGTLNVLTTFELTRGNVKGGFAYLNINGGVLKSTAHLLVQNNAATASNENGTQYVKVQGGMLDMSGMNIGSATEQVTNFDFTKGVMKNVGTVYNPIALGAANSDIREFSQTTGTGSYNGILSGASGLTKTGDGTLKFATNMTYTGATKVTGGTLALGISGDVTASSGCSFEPGCGFNVVDKTDGFTYTKTLTAYGTNAGPVAVTVAATKALALSASATLALGIAPTAPDLNQPAIAVSGGTMAFASGASMTFTNRAAQKLTAGQYKLVTGVSGTTVPAYSSDEIKKYVSDPANQNVSVEITGGDLVLKVVDAATQGSSVTTFAPPTQGVLVKSSKLTATVAPDGGSGTPSGTIQLWDAADSSGALASATLNGAGIATITLPPTVLPGTYQMYVQYMGDENFLPSFSATNTVRVTDTATWTGTGGDSIWGTVANWDVDSPNLESLKALFTNAIVSDTVVTLEANKTIGRLVFGGPAGLPTAANWTITGNTLALSDATQPVITVNAFSAGKGVSVSSSFVSTNKPFVKNGKGSITFGGSVNAIGVILDGGSVSLNGALTGTASANPLTFGLTDGSTNVSVLALANTLTIQGGLKVQTASAATNILSVPSGQTLYLNNGVSVQSLSADLNKTAFAMTGGGALVVNAATADFIVGKDNNTQTQEGTYTADLRGLASLSATNTNFIVGYETASVTYGSVGYSRLDLPDTANIKATKFGVSLGENSTAGNNEALLTLGSGTTVVNADNVYIGVGRPYIGQQGGEVRFRSSGTLKLRNKAGTGAVGSMYVGYRADTSSVNSGSRAQRSGLLDTRGGSIDAQINALTLGRDTGDSGGSSPYALGEIIVDGTGSALTVTTLNVGVGTDWVVEPRGILSITNGAVKVGTLNMNNDTKKGGRATLNLSGGSLTVTSAVNFDMAGTQTVNLNGGTLNLSGLNVGAFTNVMETFNFTSGTLKNARTNWTSVTLGGAGSKNWQQDQGTNAVMFGRILGSGTLQKWGAGKLTLANTNVNTGTLNVSVSLQQGTLACLTANALPALTNLSAMAGTSLQFVPGIPLTVTGVLSGNFTIDLADGSSVGDLNPLVKYDLILLGTGTDVSGATFSIGSTLKVPWNVSVKSGKVVLSYASGTLIRFR